MRSLPLSSVIEDDLFLFELVSWWQNNLVLHFSCCRARRHRCTFQEKRGGEKEKAPSVSLSTSCSFGELRCRATCQGRRALDRLASGSRKVLGNANASLGDGRRQSPLDNAILAAAVAAFAGPAGSSRPATGSSFDGSSSMATLNGVGSLPSSARRFVRSA